MTPIVSLFLFPFPCPVPFIHSFFTQVFSLQPVPHPHFGVSFVWQLAVELPSRVVLARRCTSQFEGLMNGATCFPAEWASIEGWDIPYSTSLMYHSQSEQNMI